MLPSTRHASTCTTRSSFTSSCSEGDGLLQYVCLRMLSAQSREQPRLLRGVPCHRDCTAPDAILAGKCQKNALKPRTRGRPLLLVWTRVAFPQRPQVVALAIRQRSAGVRPLETRKRSRTHNTTRQRRHGRD